PLRDYVPRAPAGARSHASGARGKSLPWVPDSRVSPEREARPKPFGRGTLRRLPGGTGTSDWAGATEIALLKCTGESAPRSITLSARWVARLPDARCRRCRRSSRGRLGRDRRGHGSGRLDPGHPVSTLRDLRALPGGPAAGAPSHRGPPRAAGRARDP